MWLWFGHQWSAVYWVIILFTFMYFLDFWEEITGNESIGLYVLIGWVIFGRFITDKIPPLTKR